MNNGLQNLQTSKNIDNMLKYDTRRTREAYFKINGVRWSELLRLPYMDLIRFAVVDPMHYLIMIYATTILWNMLNDNDRKILGHFVQACNLLVARFVIEDDLQEVQERLRNMSINIKRTYGPEFITSNIHLSMHIPECIRDYGSVYSFWLFPYERLNGYIGSYPNSNRQIEPELMGIVLKNSLVDYHLSCQWTSGLLENSLKFLAPKKAAGSLAVTNKFDREELQYFISLRHDTSNKIYGTEYIPGRMLTPSYEKKDVNACIEITMNQYTRLIIAYRDGTSDMYPGEVQYYFEHTLTLSKGSKIHFLVYVKWYKNALSSSIRFKHKFMEPEVSNTELWNGEYYEEGQDSIIAVHRIYNKENHLTRLFWMSSDQVDLWFKYHDVVTLISDETLDIYIWILECIRRATEQVPIVIFTDADPALDTAIPIVFLETYLVHFGQNLFPTITKVLDKYLTEPINNIIRTEISQCLFVNANMIKPSNEELNQKQICYMYETNLQESIILNCERDTYNSESINKSILPTQYLVTIPTTVFMFRKAIPVNDETSTVNAIDEIFNNTHEIQMNESNTGQGKKHRIDGVEEEDETEQDNEIIKTNLENVKNSNKAIHKDELHHTTFGIGINVSDIYVIIHAGISMSIRNLVQESGRKFEGTLSRYPKDHTFGIFIVSSENRYSGSAFSYTRSFSYKLVLTDITNLNNEEAFKRLTVSKKSAVSERPAAPKKNDGDNDKADEGDEAYKADEAYETDEGDEYHNEIINIDESEEE
ncbi:hypothetical protein Glove_621g28 [Diversispora epigaea]|uniref:DUF4218 domain-containing protein n=1 Tax=Diversispora epigaea TaxID=1348612 RepID=A0A397G615_9GLOM|nr:hypothetical protein Glove_621g28 [Diversispora epigaea]